MVENAPASESRGTKRGSESIYGDDHIEVPSINYYTDTISDERAMNYVNGKLPKPVDVLKKALDDTRKRRCAIDPQNCIVHWFKADLRVRDNRALSQAFRVAQSSKLPLVCLYIVSPEDWASHVTSNARIDFILRSLEVLHGDLQRLNIPLVIKSAKTSKSVPKVLFEFLQQVKSNTLYANIEYEVDELRREAKIVKSGLQKGIAVNLCHDTCVVNPTDLFTKTSDKPFSVFTPFYKSWVAHLCQHPHNLDETAPLSKLELHDDSIKGLLEAEFQRPEIPAEMQVSDPAHWKKLWPAGEHEARTRLGKYIDKKVTGYKRDRDHPALDATSSLSVYISAGNLAARTAVRAAIGFEDSETNHGSLRSAIDMNSSGAANWTSEIAWRDFYRNILVNFPYVCMNKPFKLKTGQIKWSENRDDFDKWAQGKTGFPIVDASMRQLLETGYMHNRGRMIVASFLTKHLLIDWRWGEHFFMRHLIDGDFSSNNGGWGFSSSCGVDAQPYFRIFNPYRQSERFDTDGKFIKRWVPELSHLDNSDIHDPYGGRNANGTGAQLAKKNGYPKPMVNHQKARQIALDTFKNAQ